MNWPNKAKASSYEKKVWRLIYLGALIYKKEEKLSWVLSSNENHILGNGECKYGVDEKDKCSSVYWIGSLVDTQKGKETDRPSKKEYV